MVKLKAVIMTALITASFTGCSVIRQKMEQSNEQAKDSTLISRPSNEAFALGANDPVAQPGIDLPASTAVPATPDSVIPIITVDNTLPNIGIPSGVPYNVKVDQLPIPYQDVHLTIVPSCAGVQVDTGGWPEDLIVNVQTFGGAFTDIKGEFSQFIPSPSSIALPYTFIVVVSALGTNGEAGYRANVEYTCS